MKRVWLAFDEFFKIGMKIFLEAFQFIVNTEFEILNRELFRNQVEYRVGKNLDKVNNKNNIHRNITDGL